MSEDKEKVTFKIHPVGVAVEPKEIEAPVDATLQDVRDTLTEQKYLPASADGQDWKFKIGNIYADDGKTLKQLGIHDGDGLKVVQEQRWARLG
jgi:hypothetical protein